MSWNLMTWLWLNLCSAAADLSGCPSRMCRWWSYILVCIDRRTLSDVDLTTLAGYAENPRSPHSQVVLHRTKESGDLPGRQAITFNVVFGQHSAEPP